MVLYTLRARRVRPRHTRAAGATGSRLTEQSFAVQVLCGAGSDLAAVDPLRKAVSAAMRSAYEAWRHRKCSGRAPGALPSPEP
mmetsp:Transcript_14675/g.43063  ORF Transcript_14675/g.43063 Transcript_14675/m.43063 type:complete len:83 (+) Transcript_14675:727-975(+)